MIRPFAAMAMLAAPVSALAQSAGGSTTTGGAGPSAAIQPAGGGQVGQAPQNSAMRVAGGGQSRQAATRVNPMGMAGMGGGDTPANALTLTAGGGRDVSHGAQGQGGDQASSVSITDTGVTRRSSAGRPSPR